MATEYPFRNLVFEGGGVKGIAYVGALEELQRRGILPRIVRVGGTSAGAINATLVALGYGCDEMRRILFELEFRSFLDDSWGVVRDAARLVREFGWYSGDFFRQWIGGLVAAKAGNPDATFNDLRAQGLRELYLVGTNLSTGFSEVYSAEHTPRMRVADAVRISMSIPLFFAAVRDRVRGDVYVDGGVLDNYPVKLFDRAKYLEPALLATHGRETEYYARENARKPATSSPYLYNRETLGFRLDAREKIAVYRDGAEPLRHTIDDFFDYVRRLVGTVLDAQDSVHLHGDDWQRTIYVDTLGVGTTDFDVSEARKSALLVEGVKGVARYFEWYDDPPRGDEPINKPPAAAPPPTPAPRSGNARARRVPRRPRR